MSQRVVAYFSRFVCALGTPGGRWKKRGEDAPMLKCSGCRAVEERETREGSGETLEERETREGSGGRRTNTCTARR
jgi:hypothetical protein